ncbi:hypothetical protein U1Q18_051133, partial [Sarracenia purpurea var. burkii]
ETSSTSVPTETSKQLGPPKVTMEDLCLAAAVEGHHECNLQGLSALGMLSLS